MTMIGLYSIRIKRKDILNLLFSIYAILSQFLCTHSALSRPNFEDHFSGVCFCTHTPQFSAANMTVELSILWLRGCRLMLHHRDGAVRGVNVSERPGRRRTCVQLCLCQCEAAAG